MAHTDHTGLLGLLAPWGSLHTSWDYPTYSTVYQLRVVTSTTKGIPKVTKAPAGEAPFLYLNVSHNLIVNYVILSLNP